MDTLFFFGNRPTVPFASTPAVSSGPLPPPVVNSSSRHVKEAWSEIHYAPPTQAADKEHVHSIALDSSNGVL